MKFPLKLSCFLVAVMFSGCASLKPVVQNARYFVLTPAHFEEEAAPRRDGSLGLHRISVPGYLEQSRLVARVGPNEIRYADNLRWAERLDKNMQQVLSANLATLLGDNVLLTAWRRDEVRVEVHVKVRQFEVAEDGTALLEADWTITEPGSDLPAKAFTSRISRKGPPLLSDPEAAVSLLSATLAQFSREIAAALR